VRKLLLLMLSGHPFVLLPEAFAVVRVAAVVLLVVLLVMVSMARIPHASRA
jgi:hypothetical protein